MANVFKRASGVRLKQKRTTQKSTAQLLSDGESEVLLDEVRKLIPQVEAVAAGQEKDANEQLKLLHEQHKAVLAKQRMTGPLG